MYDTDLELILNEKKDLGAERKKNKKKFKRKTYYTKLKQNKIIKYKFK